MEMLQPQQRVEAFEWPVFAWLPMSTIVRCSSLATGGVGGARATPALQCASVSAIAGGCREAVRGCSHRIAIVDKTDAGKPRSFSIAFERRAITGAASVAVDGSVLQQLWLWHFYYICEATIAIRW